MRIKFLIVFSIAGCVVGFGEEGKERLVLKTSACVTENYIKLLDVLEEESLSPKSKSLLESIYLGKSPDIGKVRDISRIEIEKEIERRGIDSQSFYLAGDSVSVKRVTLAEKEKNEHIINEIRQGIHRLFEKNVEVRLIFVPEKVFSCESIKEIIPVEGRRDLYLARCSIEGKEEKYEIIARIAYLEKIVVAKNTILPGVTIGPQDVELRQVEITEGEDYLRDLNMAISAKAIKRIEKDKPIRVQSIKPKPLIKKRDIILAKYKYLSTSAMALEDGSIGDIIECEYTGTKNKFRGKVISSNLVDVLP